MINFVPIAIGMNGSKVFYFLELHF